jgi:hypothetical protein
VRQYWRDWRSGNERLGRMIRVLAISWFNALQRRRGGRSYPHWPSMTLTSTPSERLNLVPGELVQVKSLDEIARTLDVNQKNRGLFFDVEMIPYCGRTFRVRQRVERIINERTGAMVTFPNDCVILEDVWCRSEFSRKRLFCPRSIYSYWREIWLRRVPAPAEQPAPVPSRVLA